MIVYFIIKLYWNFSQWKDVWHGFHLCDNIWVERHLFEVAEVGEDGELFFLGYVPNALVRSHAGTNGTQDIDSFDADQALQLVGEFLHIIMNDWNEFIQPITIPFPFSTSKVPLLLFFLSTPIEQKLWIIHNGSNKQFLLDQKDKYLSIIYANR